MLKVVVMLECDTCGEFFKPVTLSCDRNPSAWRFLAVELESRAEGCGWILYEAAFLCVDCVQDMPCIPAD